MSSAGSPRTGPRPEELAIVDTDAVEKIETVNNPRERKLDRRVVRGLAARFETVGSTKGVKPGWRAFFERTGATQPKELRTKVCGSCPRSTSGSSDYVHAEEDRFKLKL